MKLIVLDIESSGVDPWKDRIVELAAMRVDPVAPSERNDFSRFEVRSTFNAVYNPGVPIASGATQTHGYSNNDVRDKPGFEEDAPQVQALISDAVLVGYNSSQFDTIMLDCELKRCGQLGLDLTDVEEIDLFKIWIKWERRTLGHALRRFRNRIIEGAHDALADTKTTIEVLDGQAAITGLTLDEMIEISRPDLDRSGKLKFDQDGDICLSFGKHRNQKCKDIDVSYFSWMKNADFPEDTMETLRKAWKNNWAL